MDLEQSAFEALRFASAQSLKLYKQPLMVTYSGGKDSDVLLRLAYPIFKALAEELQREKSSERS